MFRIPILHFVLALAVLRPVPVSADDVLVFAPASLGGTLDRVAASFEAETGARVRVSYAGTSALAFQIRQGAPADVFVSASIDWMDALEAEGLIVAGSRADLLANSLVVVSARAEAVPLGDLPGALGEGRLAMALTEAVPAGQYGRQALEAAGLWEALAPRVVETDNVRAALRLAALGEARFAIVYATDALAEPGVFVVASIPPALHDPILYPVALVAGGGGAAFLDYLTGPGARAIFAADGFVGPGDMP